MFVNSVVGYDQLSASRISCVSSRANNIEAFEDAIKAYLGDCNKEVVVMSSREQALHYALKACRIKRTFEVCVPSFASEEVVDEVLKVNAFPVFVGSEYDTWNMDADLLEDAIDGRIRDAHIKPQAVILNAAYGMPATIHRICEVCCRRRIPLVEYSADALGSEFCGRKLGTYGWRRFGIVSFDEGSVLPCGGAALVCDSKEDKEYILKMMARHKRARMSNACAAMGLEYMAQIEERLAHHRHIYALYAELLRNVDGITVYSQPQYNLTEGEPAFYDSNYNRCNILVDGNVYDVPTLQKALHDVGIEARRLYKPLHTNPYYSQYAVYTGGVCEDLYNRGLSLPSGWTVTDDKVRHVVEAIKGKR